jgi:CRP-like cAMP-binding protein
MPTHPSASTGPNCFTCQVRERTEWCVLEENELNLINDGKISKNYLPGETIFFEGDTSEGIYCIESGLVGVRKSDADGNSVLLFLAAPGDTVGYRSLLAGEEHKSSAEILEPSTVCFVDQSTVRKLLSQNPSLGLRFLRRASKDLGDADERILHNVTLSVRARFAHLLLVLIDRHGSEAIDGSLSLKLPLSRQDLAAMIGTSPESMSRTIRKFEDDGVATFSGRAVHVPSVDSLLKEIESHLDH